MASVKNLVKNILLFSCFVLVVNLIGILKIILSNSKTVVPLDPHIHFEFDHINEETGKLWICKLRGGGILHPGGGSHIDMVYVYVPAFWGTFSRNLV